MTCLKHTLPNGLQLIAECYPEAYTLGIGFFVRAGSRDEPAESAGVSHFLEHMAFKGTPTMTAEEVNLAFDRIGAAYNAFTSEDATVYFAAVLPEFQEAACRLLAELMRPVFPTDEFDREKQVILEEIRMYLDEPPFGADDLCRARYFAQHPLGRSVLGTPESVGALTVEQMRAYHQRLYAPNNMVLAAAGRVDFDALVRQAETFCSEWEPWDTDRMLYPLEPAYGFHVSPKPSASHEYLIQLSEGPTGYSEERFAAHLLAGIVGDDSGSRLFWEFVDSGMAESASLTFSEHEDAGVFGLMLSCSEDLFSENLKRLQNVIRVLESDGITEEELQRAKRKIFTRTVLAGERPRNRLFSLGLKWLLFQSYQTVKEKLRLVEAVTLEDVNRLIQRYPFSCHASVAVGPWEAND
ncbi:M16 family metallopeptidase [Thermopirellula anaerolimosa]